MSATANMSVQPDPVIETTQGRLRGASIDDVNVFKGIPYARSARFQSPQPLAPWSGIRDALALGSSAPQPNRAAEVPWWNWLSGGQPQSEDCLVLNVFAPRSAVGRKLPVMFFLHGGGFTTGSASAPGYDGTQLAHRGDVVVVSINHRLNLFGFLYLAELCRPGLRRQRQRRHARLRRGAAMGPAEHFGVRRRSRQCHDLRPVRRRLEGRGADGGARRARAVSQGDHPERVVSDPHGDAGAGDSVGQGAVRRRRRDGRQAARCSCRCVCWQHGRPSSRGRAAPIPGGR